MYQPDPTGELLVRVIAERVIDVLRSAVRSNTEIALRNVQPKLLTVSEAGVYLGRTEQAIQHLIHRRELPVVRVGRRVHLDRNDLDRWIEKHRV